MYPVDGYVSALMFHVQHCEEKWAAEWSDDDGDGEGVRVIGDVVVTR